MWSALERQIQNEALVALIVVVMVIGTVLLSESRLWISVGPFANGDDFRALNCPEAKYVVYSVPTPPHSAAL